MGARPAVYVFSGCRACYIAAAAFSKLLFNGIIRPFSAALKEYSMSEDKHVHESPIKTPGQLITVVVLSFLIPIVLIVILSQLVTTGPKADPAALNADAIAGRERARQKLISIEARRRPIGEILAEIAKRSDIPIEYDKPEREPLATIVLKDGSVFDALQYLALRGNFALTFESGNPHLGPNPPPDLPHEIGPLRYEALAVPGKAVRPPPSPPAHIVVPRSPAPPPIKS